MREIVEAPTDRHFDQRGLRAEMHGLVERDDIAGARIIGRAVMPHHAAFIEEAMLNQEVDAVLAEVPGRRAVAPRALARERLDRLVGAHQASLLLVAR